jgi:sigma-B regulation protein RsbU (phosphoserine phosphatase)
MFVTLWLGIIDLTTGKVLAANAGHEDPAICRKDGSFELAKTRHGLVAGAMPGIRYRDAEFYLAPGDKVFLYTDGVPEATDGENRMFTLDRMLVTLNTVKNGSPEEILEGVHQEVNAFVGEAPQFDDLTMLCLEYKGR